MNNYTELKKLCTTFSRGFESIKQLAWDLGHSNKTTKKIMLEILKSGPDQIAMENEIQGSFLYMLSEVFQDPKAMKQLRLKHEAELIPAGLAVLTFWEKNPAFWCFFTVKEHLNGDFYQIVDHLTGEEHILHSKGISTFQKLTDAEGLRFLCLMQPNGGCLQTVGMIKYYRILVSDFLFYCSLFKPEEGLQAIIHKHFIKFFTLDVIAILPPFKRDNYDMLFIWQPFTLPDFDIAELGGAWFSSSLGSRQRFTVNIIDTSMLGLPNLKVFETAPSAMAGAIIRDNATDEMALFTNTEVAYAFFSALLNRSYPKLKLPKKPLFLISGALQHVLTKVSLPVPWKEFEDIIEYREPQDKVEKNSKEEWEKLREEYKKAMEDLGPDNPEMELMMLYIDAQISGKPMDTDKICKATGLDRDYVENLFGRFDNFSDEEALDAFDDALDDDYGDEEDSEDMVPDDYAFYIISDEDKVYEMDGWPVLEDAYGDTLYHTLSDSEIFVVTISKMEEAHRQFLQLVSEDYALEIERYGMLASIDRLFTNSFDEELAQPLMNAFFWIFLHKGKDWVPVRSYAIEILKWIPSDILPFYVDHETFIEAFSKFVKRLLCTRGVCSLAKRPSAEDTKKGTYAIKGTDAFFSLLQVRDFDE